MASPSLQPTIDGDHDQPNKPPATTAGDQHPHSSGDEAEEHYTRAKESAAKALKRTTESIAHGAGAAVAYAAAKSVEARDMAQSAAKKAKDVTVSTGRTAVEYIQEKAKEATTVDVAGEKVPEGEEATVERKNEIQRVEVDEEEEPVTAAAVGYAPTASIGWLLEAVGGAVVGLTFAAVDFVLGLWGRASVQQK